MALVLSDRLERAARPGALRDLGLAWHQALRQAPERAGALLSQGLRQTRSLHSRDRRLLGELSYALLRESAALDHLLGEVSTEARWLGLLVRAGLDPVEADAAWQQLRPGPPPPWEKARTPAEALPWTARCGLVPEIAEALADALGEEAGAFLDASNRRGPVTLRVNLPRITPAALVERLAAEGVQTTPHPWRAGALDTVQGQPITTAAWREGLFEVQDAGSQALVDLIPDEGPGLDVCAGAGGKALALAARGTGPLYLCDVRAEALAEAERRAQRAGVKLFTRLAAHGALPRPPLTPRWVLVDAPCSGLGILRRHPEHRLLVDGEALARLTALQQRLLRQAAAFLPPGGALVYATCSPLREENEAQVQAFLADHPQFTLEPPPDGPARDGDYYRTLPHRQDCDALFGARLRRTR